MSTRFSSSSSSSSVGLGKLVIGVILATGLGTILVEFLVHRPRRRRRRRGGEGGGRSTETGVANNLTHLIGKSNLYMPKLFI